MSLVAPTFPGPVDVPAAAPAAPAAVAVAAPDDALRLVSLLRTRVGDCVRPLALVFADLVRDEEAPAPAAALAMLRARVEEGKAKGCCVENP